MILNEKAQAEFEGKVVVVTGAARGIGKATALEFGRQGASLVIVDALETELQGTSKIICEMGREVLPTKADVSSNDEVQDVVKKALDRFGE